MQKKFINPTYKDLVGAIVDRTNMYPNIRIKEISIDNGTNKGIVKDCWFKNIKLEKILVSTPTRPKGILNIKDIKEIEFF